MRYNFKDILKEVRGLIPNYNIKFYCAKRRKKRIGFTTECFFSYSGITLCRKCFPNIFIQHDSTDPLYYTVAINVYIININFTLFDNIDDSLENSYTVII